MTMCDDLIAKHYIHSAPAHVLHPPPAEGTTHFTLHPNRHTWLILHPSSDAFSDPGLLDTLRPKWSTINSYDARTPLWAHTSGHNVQRLREMRLRVGNAAGTTITASGLPTPAASPTSSTFTLSQSPLATATAATPTPRSPTPPKGYAMSSPLTTKTWFLSRYPALANTVHGAGTQIFAVTDISKPKAIPQRAGWITVVPDTATRRAYVSSLEVAQAHRRRGLATFLLGAVANWWARDGAPGELWLTVFEENKGAVELYEGLGFETVRTLWVVTKKGTKEEHDGA